MKGGVFLKFWETLRSGNWIRLWIRCCLSSQNSFCLGKQSLASTLWPFTANPVPLKISITLTLPPISIYQIDTSMLLKVHSIKPRPHRYRCGQCKLKKRKNNVQFKYFFLINKCKKLIVFFGEAKNLLYIQWFGLKGWCACDWFRLQRTMGCLKGKKAKPKNKK